MEALHILVLITNLMDGELTNELVQFELILKLSKFVDVEFMRTSSTIEAAELTL